MKFEVVALVGRKGATLVVVGRAKKCCSLYERKLREWGREEGTMDTIRAHSSGPEVESGR